MTRYISLGVSALVLALGSAALGQDTNSNLSGLYRLSSNSTYQRGCFDPCLCPLMLEAPVQGTFRLKFVTVGDLHDFWTISEINWRVSSPYMDELIITGDGTYYRTNFGEPMHHVALNLKIGDEPVQQFWSESVPAEYGLNHIDLTVSINGIFCFDTVIRMDAFKVPSTQIKRYRIQPQSTYQEGCFDPCDCLIYAPVPYRGSMGLVFVGASDTGRNYAVTDIQWKVPQASVNAIVPVTGYGWLHVPNWNVDSGQALSAKLMFGDDGPFHFETHNSDVVGPLPALPNVLGPTAPSKLTPIAPSNAWPAIHTTISMNGMVCYDRVFGVFALPSNVPTAIAP